MDPNPYESPQAVDKSTRQLVTTESRVWTWTEIALMVGVILTVFGTPFLIIFGNPILGLCIAFAAGFGIVLQTLANYYWPR